MSLSADFAGGRTDIQGGGTMAFAMNGAKKLGRGLKSLLGDPDMGGDTAVLEEPASGPGAVGSGLEDAVDEPAGERVIELDPEVIRPNPFQPRADFDETGLAELADSMRTAGVLSPLLVRRTGDGAYELIAGERRLRAAKRAGLAKVPVLVRRAGDAEALENALIENLQRRDLNPIEKAKALSEYLTMHRLSQTEGEKRLGLSRSELANHIRLLRLTGAVQELVRGGALSYGHARALVAVEDPLHQEALAKKAAAEGLSVRELEELVKQPPAEPPAGAKADKPVRKPDPQIRELQDEFAETLGVKVAIKPGRKPNTGVITIPYSNLDDFDRIRAVITGKN
jgi:ParB family chromosome partitioning protein